MAKALTLITICCVAAGLAAPVVAQITNRNPYASGIEPWQKSLRDVNLANGNLFKSYTDIKVAAARGAGLVLQRSYNSNDVREGPFGVGWTDSYDMRTKDTTADTMERTDCLGGKHSYIREADGLYNPPSYIRSVTVSATDPNTDAVTADIEESKDGTTDHYTLIGNYRVCDWIQDRHGNKTQLTYDANGQVQTVEDLTSGRMLTFTWNDVGQNGEHHERITHVAASYGGNVFQQVDYQYYLPNPPYPDPLYPGNVPGSEYYYPTGSGLGFSTDDAYNLYRVILYPGGGEDPRVTTYTYTSYTSGPNNPYPGVTDYNLLQSVRDPLWTSGQLWNTTTPNAHSVIYTYGDVGGYIGAYLNYIGAWVTQIDEPGSSSDSRYPGTTRQVWTLSNLPYGNPGGFGDTFGIAWGSNVEPLIEWSESENPLNTGFSDTTATAVMGIDVCSYEYTYDSDMNLIYSDRDTGAINTDLYSGMPGPNSNNTNIGAEDIIKNTTYHNNGTPYQSYYSGWENDITTTQSYGVHDYFQKKSTVNANGIETDYAYYDDSDASLGNRGNVHTVTVDPAGLNLVTEFTYNQYGQVATKTDPNGVAMQYNYGESYMGHDDPWGDLTSVMRLCQPGRQPPDAHHAFGL